jgi:hypothetical protein
MRSTRNPYRPDEEPERLRSEKDQPSKKLSKTQKILVIAIVIIGIIALGTFLYVFPKASPPAEACPPANKVSEGNTQPVRTGQVIFYVDCLSSGDRTTYERKAVIGAEFPKGERKEYLAWGDEIIPIFGRIASIPKGEELADKIVMINSTQNGELIFKQFVTTNTFGLFGSRFFAPEDGTIQVTATLVRPNSSADEATISVIATQSWMPLIMILILTIISLSSIVGFWLFAKHSTSRNKGKILRISVIPAIIPIALAYFILYKFPPFNEVGNAAIGTILIAPIIAYIIELLRKA